MSRDPIAIAKCFSQLIQEEDIEDIRINRRRNIIAVQLAKPTKDNFSKLLNLRKISSYAVKGYKPSEEQLGVHCTGVIGPISLDVDLEELSRMIKSLSSILKLARLPKFSNSKKEESLAIKIDFKGNELPAKVKLGYVSFVVKEYNPPPLSCYQSQRIGHLLSLIHICRCRRRG